MHVKNTWGWNSSGAGLRYFSFRAPTGSISFLFSTLLDNSTKGYVQTKVNCKPIEYQYFSNNLFNFNISAATALICPCVVYFNSTYSLKYL